jgi:hypothetical protein
VLDDIRGGFIRGKLDIVNLLVPKTTFTGDIADEIPYLIEKFELGGELNQLHP